MRLKRLDLRHLFRLGDLAIDPHHSRRSGFFDDVAAAIFDDIVKFGDFLIDFVHLSLIFLGDIPTANGAAHGPVFGLFVVT